MTDDNSNVGSSYRERENMWDDAWPNTGNESRHPTIEPDDLDETGAFPGVVGTSDALGSIHDGEPYTPPTDPPVLPGGPEGIHIATGFGLSTDETALQDPAPQGDEDIRDEALLALQQDSLTSKYPLDVDVNDGFVTLRGLVPSIDDADHAMSVLTNLPGVVDVIDETTLAASTLE